jgi:hypothetical protein
VSTVAEARAGTPRTIAEGDTRRAGRTTHDEHASEEAIDYALGTAEGGWPHDALSVLQDARLQALISMRKVGVPFDEALDTINLNEAQARLLLKVNEPDDATTRN